MIELTPGEKAYLESGGQDATALLAENAAPTSESAPVAPEPAIDAGAATSEPAAQAPAVVQPEPIELGEEEIPTADGKSKRRMVDSRALREARQRAKAAEDQLNEERQLRARVDERLKLLTEVVSQPDPAPQQGAESEDEAPIDPEQDIFGAYKQLMKKVERLEGAQGDMRAQTESERQANVMVTTYKQDAAAFTARQPDFNDAYNFLLTKRSEQLKNLGYGDNDIRQILYNEEINLASRAIGMRQSPAAQIYGLAQSMGYAKAAPAPTPGPVSAPTAPVAPQVPSVTAEIDRIKAGQASSRSLSAGGGAAGEELSLERLAAMSDKEFGKFMEIPGNRDKVEQALGRRAA